MKIYEASQEDDFIHSLITTLETEVGEKVFTMRILDTNDSEEGFDAVIVFEDKNILMGHFTVQSIKGKTAIRIRANFL